MEQSTADRIAELKEAIRQSPGWRLRRELASLSRSDKVFRGNDRELQTWLGKQLAGPEAVLELWDMKNRDGFEQFLDEVDRLLHNYLAGVGTLRDHSRAVWKRHPPPDEDARVEYERWAAWFRDFPLSQFVQRLRNYSLHERLPVARGNLSWLSGGRLDSKVILERETLLRWDGWNSSAQTYLEEIGRDVDLSRVVTDYSGYVGQFIAWLMEAFTHGHQEELAEVENMRRELASMYRQ